MPSHVHASDDPLPSWNATPTKNAIVAFVKRVTTKGSKEFVPPAERIATFDNDGTLWAEQPFYFQIAYTLDRIKALAPKHPEWKTQMPFAAVLRGDLKDILKDDKSMAQLLAVTHTGMTTDEFQKVVSVWLSTARHPQLHRPYTECVYQPMLEMLSYLRANGFKTYIVSGGGVEFIRVWAEEAYGIPPEQVIGSVGKEKFEIQNGKPVLVKLPAVDFVNDKENKPIGIQKVIGRRPIAAFGNSDGDQQMLQWTTAAVGARLGLIVHHTDAKREWAYDRKSNIGKLDKALDEAKTRGWVVVNMREDWKVIYPPPRRVDAPNPKASTSQTD